MIIRAKAPLRLGLAGGGTDVSPFSDDFGGFVLNATIDLYAHCTIEPTDDGQVSFVAADRQEAQQHASAPRLPLDGTLDLHKGVYNRVVAEFNGGLPLSFRMTTYADAPAGSGLGSSSTLVVVILAAFCEWLNLPLGEYDLAHLAYEVERIDLALSGGKQDQYAATFGGFNFIEFYGDDRVVVNPLRVKSWIIDELEASMILYYTGASRESAAIIDEQRARVLEKNHDSVTAMHAIKSDATRMKEALLKGDLDAFAATLNRSWEAKKRMAARISNPTLDAIYDDVMALGARAGKVSGAGGGGFMMFVVDPIRKVAITRALESRGGQVMNFHFVKYGVKGWRL